MPCGAVVRIFATICCYCNKVHFIFKISGLNVLSSRAVYLVIQIPRYIIIENYIVIFKFKSQIFYLYWVHFQLEKVLIKLSN